MKDSISIRITFCKSAEKTAQEIIDFIEKNIEGLNIQKAREGGNPKYKKGGTHYDESQGEFLLAYSRLNIKKGVPQLPKIKPTK